MTSTVQGTIIIQGDALQVEGIAGATITPGMIVEQQADGEFNPHGGAGLNWAGGIALENRQEIPATGAQIDNNYVDNDSIQVGYPWRGSLVNLILAASAAAIVIGDFLESDGDGTVRILTTDAATDDTQRASVVAVATEAVDNSGGGTTVRIEARII